MKTRKTYRKAGRLLLGAFLLGALAQTARAGDTDSLTVTITPNAQYIVDIDTGPGGGDWLDLGGVNLAQSTWTVRPATVTIQSTWATTELSLEGAMLSGGWTFDGNTANNEANALKAWAVFTDTSVGNSPTPSLNGYFSGTQPDVNGSDVIKAAFLGVGTGGGKTMFVADPTEPGYKSMEDLPSDAVDPAASRAHLWLRFTLPPSTTDMTPKKIYLTLKAAAPAA